VDRTISTRLNRVRRSLRGASAALATTDGRWAVVSTSITGLVAGSMAWLAASAMPPLHVKTQEASTTFLPYKLFTQLVAAGNNLISGSGDSPASRAVPPPAQLDHALADEEAGDNGNAAPGIETRTITLESGDTLAGVLEDAGVPKDDTNAAILALTKVYELRSARAGQSFALTFDVPPAPPPAQAPMINTLATDSDADGADGNNIVIPVATLPVGRLLSVSFSPSIEHDITVARQADGKLCGQRCRQAARRAHATAPARRSTPRSISPRPRPAFRPT